MAVFGEELFRRTPFKFWVLAPCAAFGALAITLPLEYRDAWHLWSVVACDAALLLLVASLWPYHRVPYVRRALAGLVAACYAFYALGPWLPGEAGERFGTVRPWQALLGLLVIGWPSLKYLLLGRFSLRVPPVAFDPQDERMLRAEAEARAAVGELVALLPRAAKAYVRFRFESRPEDAGAQPEIEHLWGEVLERRAVSLVVRVATAPAFHSGEPPDTLEVALADLSDWEVELEDGTLAGGFTTRAMVEICDRDGLDVPAEVRRRLGLYRVSEAG